MTERIFYRFGAFELDPAEGQLRRQGRQVALQELPLRLLTALVEEAGALVSREALQERLWPGDVVVDFDGGLNTAVRRAREALGDSASQPRFIVTVPRRGYRFVAPVERVMVAGGKDSPKTSRGRLAMAGAVLLAVALAAAVAVWTMGRADSTSSTPPVETSFGASPLPGDVEGVEDADILEAQARHFADRRSREGLEKAIAAYQSALALEPERATAYGGLARAYMLLGIYDYWRPREAFQPAETMARRALALDATSADAHLAMGLVAAAGHWDWGAAQEHLDKALALAPDSAESHHWHGVLQSALGRYDTALASLRRAARLAPTSPVIQTSLAWHLFYARRFDEAVAQSHRALELAPGYYDAWDNLKWIHLTAGDEVAAVQAWARALDAEGRDGAALEAAYACHGLRALMADSVAGMLERHRSGRYQSPFDLVLEYAWLGEVEPALDLLERSFAERETDLVVLAVDPRVDALRGEPRFQAILTEVGLPGE